MTLKFACCKRLDDHFYKCHGGEASKMISNCQNMTDKIGSSVCSPSVIESTLHEELCPRKKFSAGSGVACHSEATNLNYHTAAKLIIFLVLSYNKINQTPQSTSVTFFGKYATRRQTRGRPNTIIPQEKL